MKQWIFYRSSHGDQALKAFSANPLLIHSFSSVKSRKSQQKSPMLKPELLSASKSFFCSCSDDFEEVELGSGSEIEVSFNVGFN